MKRVLHCLHSLNIGGIETWLKNIHKELNHELINFDFLVRKKGVFDKEIEKLGGRIYILPSRSNLINFFFILKLIIKNKYNAIHIHAPEGTNTTPLIAGWLCCVKNRIFQFHSQYQRDLKISWKKSIKVFLGFLVIRLFANKKISVSILSDQSAPFFKKHFYKNTETIYLGIDFSTLKNKSLFYTHENFNLDPNKKTIVHIGRLNQSKNHFFLLEVVAALAKRKQGFQIILFGDGELRNAIEEKIKQLALQDFVFLAGWTENVMPIMRDIGTLFLFPSKFEGLPLAVVEAQAAGLQCLIADTITPDTIFTDQVEILSLDDSIDIWVDKCIYLLGKEKDFVKSYELAINSPYNIDNSLKHFENLWLN